MKVCCKWVCLEGSWVDFECFYTLLWGSRWLFNFFLLLLTLFGRFWTNSESKMGQNGPEMGQNGSFWGGFGPFLGRSGSLWDHFGIVWGSSWCRFDPILRLFGLFLDIFGHFFCSLLSPFWPILGHFHRHVAIFWWRFGKLTVTLSKMMQEKANICIFVAKIHQHHAKLCKNKPFSAVKHFFPLKTVKIDVSTYESVL